VSDRGRSRDLKAGVASTHPSEFLPVRRQADRQEPLDPPTLLDALDLDRGRWLLVLQVASALLVSAAGEDTIAGWRRAAEADLDAATASIDGVEGSRLREREGAIRGELARLRGPDTISIPIHGDLHFGQFLRWRGGLAVSDLDGDPLGPGTLEGSPAKDVASLVQSLDQVGRIVERRRVRSLTAWIREVSDACLESYRGELSHLGASALFDERLLRPLRVAQELHEFVYAVRYLPSWRYVPEGALAPLLDGAS
jgi:maltokinase